MATKLSVRRSYDEDEDEEDTESIQWSNIIFLPFHPTFQLLVLWSVILKCTIAPILAVFPVLLCSDMMDKTFLLANIKFAYVYYCDVIYGIDTFFHFVHGQLIEQAMRREHLPKSEFLLILDICSLIPFFRLLVHESCPPTLLFPNILCFNETLTLYRVVKYFSLATTHSYWKLIMGFTLLFMMFINIISCFILLLTIHGLCENCTNGIYDWRSYILDQFNNSSEDVTTYVYGSAFVTSFFVNELIGELKPSTIWEFRLSVTLIIISYLLNIFVMTPKMFAESLHRIRRICSFHPRVARIIDETKRRNPSPLAHKSVEKFYSLIWKKRHGITYMPEIISELPRYLRIDVRLDLFWPAFYHSPTFRKTSMPYQRWLCDHIRLVYKLPGERFYAGPHCFSNLYYLKSGVVQLISADDSTSGILSLTSGTVFGDTSFLIPPLKRKVIARCLTYCEVFVISRAGILKSLYKFPEDRRMIMDLAKDRIKHAYTLYACKTHVRGVDRSEDEGIAWIKRRWWEIFDLLACSRNTHSKECKKVTLAPEETPYHCAKYIGQLVLCTDVQLQSKTMFANVNFPWILLPQSKFVYVWHRIILYLAYMVLISFPPNITKPIMPPWFTFFKSCVDLFYIADIFISLCTSLENQEHLTSTFSEVMFARCKTFQFIMDIFSTLWVERFAVLIGQSQFYRMCQFNRLLKTYVLFSCKFRENWKRKHNPLNYMFFSIALTHFCYVYISGYFFFLIDQSTNHTTTSFFYGLSVCSNKHEPGLPNCDPSDNSAFSIVFGWILERIFTEHPPFTVVDVVLGILLTFFFHMLFLYTRSNLIAAMYLKYRDSTNYHYFVSNLKQHYIHHKIHPDLLRRLDRYLICHWKYYNGMDVMYPSVLKDEPYDIYWKLHGAVAERIIKQSKAFEGADPKLIRDLAQKAKYLILPKKSTLFMFGVQCKNVTWVVNGVIKCEYHNEHGKLLEFNYTPGQVLSFTSVVLGKPSLRTYAAATECEILFVSVKDFFTTLKHYPAEFSYYETCMIEFGPVFDEMFLTYLRKHKDYQKNLRSRVFHARKTKTSLKKTVVNSSIISEDVEEETKKLNFWGKLESPFIRYWIMFRAIVVFISILCSALQGGSGAVIRRQLMMVSVSCDVTAVIDIVLKLCMPYYDGRGIIINDFRKCVIHYISRGFLLDIIGTLPVHEIFSSVMSRYTDDDLLLFMHTICKFAHLYILMGYFNYLADMPTINASYIMILKWQIVTVLVMLTASHFFMTNCVNFTWDENYELVDMQLLNKCWVPKYLTIEKKHTMEKLHILYAESIHLSQNGLLRMNLGMFHIDRESYMGVIFVMLGVYFWYIMCMCQTLLVLNYRGNTLFQHGVDQLKRFLEAERVDTTLIDRVLAYFSYWWMRTKGLNIQSLMNERIGVVFRQDLSFYFYKKTFAALDSLLHGGETLERQLASVITQAYFLPGEEILREMDLSSSVFIVHRGKVIISQNDCKLAALSMGSIFGQLQSTTIRPSHISARADDYVDILQISIKQFHENINDEVREHINNNPQSANDFMALKKTIRENPYNTVQYLMRGHKTIKLPWMPTLMEARKDNIYARWLVLAWLVSPYTSAFVSTIAQFVPILLRHGVLWALLPFDFIHVVQFLTEFYTMKLDVENNRCVYVYNRIGVITQWGFFFDLFSLTVPLLTVFTGDWMFQLARLCRLHLWYNYHKNFCSNFQTKYTPSLMKFALLILIMNCLTVGWILVACRDEKFPIPLPLLTADVNTSIDWGQWTLPGTRANTGCARVTKKFLSPENKTIIGFIVPKDWHDDYIIAFTNMIVVYAHLNMDSVLPLTVGQIYYKIIATIILYLMELWISSVIISVVYTKFRELYQYDYHVSNLNTYLKLNDLSSTLLRSVWKYTRLLWARQRGNWLPEIAQQAPYCMREDIFSALYMHHLHAPVLFHDLPDYFLRQLVARLHRVVVFPGKSIVQEGDIFPCIYFIHEGEVEKWYTDESGESRMGSLLTTNGYFGLIPGLFPNVPYRFTFLTRTVVDLIYLRYRDWQDLLNSYPDVKDNLYTAANNLNKHTGI